MSPHNNTRFNGSGINSPSSYHSGQNELGLAMGRLTSYIGGLIYTYSGLKSFKSRRFFKRGISNEKIQMPPLENKITMEQNSSPYQAILPGDQDETHNPL